MKVIGIDPGTRLVGYAVIEKKGSRLITTASGVIKAKTQKDLPSRLKVIHEEITELIKEHQPDTLAVEKVFCGKNVQSAMRIGESRGAILLAAAQANLLIAEYDPTKIKKAVVGAGKAHKTQVQYMVKMLLGLEKEITFDEADALAIAICHCQQPDFLK